MALPTSYLRQVAWSTNPYDIVRIDAATYQLTVVPLDVNDVGWGQKAVGYYLIDYIGHYYSVSAINVGSDPDRIEIKDSFETGKNPLPGRLAYVYKSVGNGNSPFLAPVLYQRLDRSAMDYAKSIELDILWKSKGDIDQIIGISDRNVSRNFVNFYKLAPIGTVNVYRVGELMTGKPTRNQVLYYSLNVTTAGFSLVIDESEDLSGVIIDYNFTSAT